ncbi:acyl-protein thioesterase 1-like [Haliotis cracherodii]|uniref:acyl-protein thioesterase 1-like n=1 Tax=Haliotis cracherodii TaxID=6455 RepID=UPI0039ECDF56
MCLLLLNRLCGKLSRRSEHWFFSFPLFTSVSIVCMGTSSSQEMPPPVVVPPGSAPHRGTLIFLHGLGDTGNSWAENFRMLKLPNIKCICPTAAIAPVSLNGGFPMTSWFDIYGLSADSAEDEEGIKKASNIIKSLIEEEEKAGIPSNQIVIGGFSQGGAVALNTAFNLGKPLGGVLALSTWMPLHKKFMKLMEKPERPAPFPILQCHGTQDPLVALTWGEATRDLIKIVNPQLMFKTYPMGHSSCSQEMVDVQEFLKTTLLPTGASK